MTSRIDFRRSRHLAIAWICVGMAGACGDAVAQTWIPIKASDKDFTYLPESAIRIGDHVYLAGQSPTFRYENGAMVRDDTSRATVLSEFDCATRRDRMLLLDHYQGNNILRLFEDGSRAYKQAVFKPLNDSAAGRDQLNAICALPLHRERLVNVGRGDGDTLFQIDTRSVKDAGQLRTVWARVDYPKIALHPPYGAPYDSVRELIALDCDARAAQVLIRYYFSPAGGITDATRLLDRPDPAIPFEADPFIDQVAHTVCGKSIDPDHFAGPIGGSVMRAKPDAVAMPPIEAGPISSEIRTAAEAFNRALPGVAHYSKAIITATSTTPSFARPQTRTSMELEPQPDGSTLVRESYQTFYVDRATVGGFAQLGSKMIDNTPANLGSTTELLDAAVPQFADGATFGYRTVTRSFTPDRRMETSKTCKIGKAIDASALNAALTGQAWPVDCTGGDGSMQSGYYVEALRFFLVLREEAESYGVSTTHIDTLSIQH